MVWEFIMTRDYEIQKARNEVMKKKMPKRLGVLTARTSVARGLSKSRRACVEENKDLPRGV